MSDPRYPSGEEIHAGDRLLFGGQPARIIFVTQRKEYAAGVLPSDWDFVRGDTIGVQFEDGRIMMYDSFCHHDAITVLAGRAVRYRLWSEFGAVILQHP